MIDLNEFKNVLSRENEEDECNTEMSFQPIVKNGRIVAVAMIMTCHDCGDSFIEQVYTDNSDEDFEELLIDAGFRDYEFEE